MGRTALRVKFFNRIGRMGVLRSSISSPHSRPPTCIFNDRYGAGRSRSRTTLAQSEAVFQLGQIRTSMQRKESLASGRFLAAHFVICGARKRCFMYAGSRPKPVRRVARKRSEHWRRYLTFRIHETAVRRHRRTAKTRCRRKAAIRSSDRVHPRMVFCLRSLEVSRAAEVF